MAKTNSSSNASGINPTVPLGGLVTGSSGSASGQRQGNYLNCKYLFSYCLETRIVII